MQKIKMTITRALNEVKLLEKRINKTIESGQFIGHSLKNGLVNDVATKSEFIGIAESTYCSIGDLIKRRNLIKSAIIKSNSEAMIEINWEKMTVAEAIERKTSINIDITLLEHLKREYSKVVKQIEAYNSRVEMNVSNILQATFNTKNAESDTFNQKNSVDEVVKSFRENNQLVLVDPLKLETEIKSLELKIDTFISEVDFVLSESNSLTTIEV